MSTTTKSLLLFIWVLPIFSTISYSQSDAFITIWDTSKPGVSNSSSILIPTNSGHTYDYDVDWDDDGIYEEKNITGDAFHDFVNPGKYRVRIRGNFPRIYFNNGGDKEKLVEIEQWGNIKWENLNSAFEGCTNLTVLASDTPDLSIVASMSEMFRRATNFTGDLSGWDVSNVPWMVATFQETESFNSDISSWDVSSCNSIRFMFDEASAFNQDISNWNISLMTDLQNTFNGARSFDQDLGDWDMNQVTNLNNFFSNSGMSRKNYDRTLIGWEAQDNLQPNLNVGADGLQFCNSQPSRDSLLNSPINWSFISDTENCTGAAFRLGYDLESSSLNVIIFSDEDYDYLYDIDWDNDGIYEDLNRSGNTGHTFSVPGYKVVNIRGKYPKFNSTQKSKIIEVVQWGEIEWHSMEEAFQFSSLEIIPPTEAPDLSHATTMASMFRFSDVFNSNLEHWDVSNIENMSDMFEGTRSYNQTLEKWNVSNVTDMSSMFKQTESFNQPLEKWNVSNVINMGAMFRETQVFNQPLVGWDVSRVTQMSSMFREAEAFNQPLEAWNTSNVTGMSAMFQQAAIFNQPLEGWDVSNVTTTTNMFFGASFFNQPLNGWQLDSMRSISTMFKDAISFNQPLSNWDVSNVRTFFSIFKNASSFDQDLGSWNFKSSIGIFDMLDSCGMSVASYDATLIGWAANQENPASLTIDAATLQYCAGESARQSLIDKGWTFNGDMLFCSGPCTPLDNTYIGPIDGSWPSGANWSLGVIPDTCSNVIIPDGKVVRIMNDYQATCNRIIVEENAELEIETGSSLITTE